jgi:hypothetical protein
MLTPSMPSENIAQSVDNLPESNVTTMLLQGLDFVVPGEWRNTRSFDALIGEVTGSTDPAAVAAIRQRALQLYADPANNYQKAVQVYRLVDKADLALGAAALANKLGQQIQILSFISRLTPKADTTQAIDLAVKLAAEAVAFSLLNGLKYDRLDQFAQALSAYGGASLMRLAALVCVDGVIPLGPDFVEGVGGLLRRTRPAELQNNAVFQRFGQAIPGATSGAQLGFLQDTLQASQGWLNGFVGRNGLTRDKVLTGIGRFIHISDEVLDYVGAFLDASTNYVEHTGIQTVSRLVVERAR